MSSSPIQIVQFETGNLINAVLQTDLSPRILSDVEAEWGPIRRSSAKRLVRKGVPLTQIPHHWHWDWGAKSSNLKFLAYRCFGIECLKKMQGLMMVVTGGRIARFGADVGKPIVYIDYLESAPWNVIPLAEIPQFKGIGMVLIRAAIQLSIDEGFHGRIGLHALPQSEHFYRHAIGMLGGDKDPNYQDLPYFELTRDLANKFITN